MRDNLNKRKKQYAVITAFFLTVAILLSGCKDKQSDVNLSEMGPDEIVLSEQDEETDRSSEAERASAKQERNSSDEKTGADSRTGDSNKEESGVFVYVCGEVQVPGVYELPGSARVFEAIALAGGVTEAAAPEAVNQARVVVDGEQIYVPSVEEVQATGVVSEVTECADNGKININTAGKEELMTLAGIGESKASSIIQYREEHGGFQSIEELMQIEGIKEGVFNKIKEDITI